MLLNSHKIECENAGFEAAYSPSFYYAILEGGDFDLNVILSKISTHVKLAEQERDLWSDYVHEYIHFLQDLRCGYLRKLSLDRAECLYGVKPPVITDQCCQVDFDGRISVRDISHLTNDCYNVSTLEGSGLILNDLALIEGVAVIIQDVVRGAHRSYDSWPYDLTKRIVEFKVKSLTLREDVERITIQASEAALMFKNPVEAFLDVLSDIENNQVNDYAKMLEILESKGYRREEASVDDAFLRKMKTVYKSNVFDGMLEWLGERVNAVASFADKGCGMFGKIYSNNDEPDLVGSVCDAIAKINHPLLTSMEYLYVGDGVNESCVRSQIALETAYNIKSSRASKNSCLMRRFCSVARNPKINPRFQSAPIVIEACEQDPRTAYQPGGKDCDFSLVWKAITGII